MVQHGSHNLAHAVLQQRGAWLLLQLSALSPCSSMAFQPSGSGRLAEATYFGIALIMSA
jgi:hypothetical protein